MISLKSNASDISTFLYHAHHQPRPEQQKPLIMTHALSTELVKALHSASEIIVNTFQDVQTMTSNYLKLAAEEERRERERNKPPKVYFEKDGPFPEEQDRERRHEEKKHGIQASGKKEEKKDKAAVAKPKEASRAKPPPQYLNYRKEEECAKTSSNKQPEKVNLDTSAEKEDSNSKKVAKVQPIVSLPAKKVPPPTPVLRPKAPVSAFLRFNKAHIEHVRANCPHIIQTDLVTVTGHMWKNLDPEQKKKYEDSYARDKQRYDAEMIEFFKRYPNQKKSKKQIQREKVASSNNK